MIEVVQRKEIDERFELSSETDKYLKSIKLRSGAYAILMSLYFYTKTNKDCLTKDEIGSQSSTGGGVGQQFCNQPLLRPDPHGLVNELFAAWHQGIKTLEKHKLVIRSGGTKQSNGSRHHQFHLSSIGEFFIQQLFHERTHDIINSKNSDDGAAAAADTPDIVKARSLMKERTTTNKTVSSNTKTKASHKQGTILNFFSKVKKENSKKENAGGGNNHGDHHIKREDSPATTTKTVPSSPTTNGKKRAANVVSPSPKKSKKM